MAKVEMMHVPYRGARPRSPTSFAGRVDVMFNVIAAVLPLVQGGQLRGLAVTTAKRAQAAPQLPTIAEVGRAGLRHVVLVRDLRAGQDTAARSSGRCTPTPPRRCADPAIKAKLDGLGVIVVGSTPDELAALLKSEMEKWAPVIKAAGIKVEP